MARPRDAAISEVQIPEQNDIDENCGEDVPPFPSWETVSCVGSLTIQDRQPEGPHPLLHVQLALQCWLH